MAAPLHATVVALSGQEGGQNDAQPTVAVRLPNGTTRETTVADLTSIRKKKETQFQDREDRDHDDALRIANFAAQPARTAQPEAGLNAALGSAFNTSGTSNNG